MEISWILCRINGGKCSSVCCYNQFWRWWLSQHRLETVKTIGHHHTMTRWYLPSYLLVEQHISYICISVYMHTVSTHLRKPSMFERNIIGIKAVSKKSSASSASASSFSPKPTMWQRYVPSDSSQTHFLMLQLSNLITLFFHLRRLPFL